MAKVRPFAAAQSEDFVPEQRLEMKVVFVEVAGTACSYKLVRKVENGLSELVSER